MMAISRSARRSRRHARGFTLLEVLVGFALFGVLYTVLLNVMAGALRNADVSRQYDHAAMHARSLLAGIGRVTPLEEGEWSGAYEQGPKWTMTISSASDVPGIGRRTGQMPRLYAVELVLRWGEGRDERTYRVSTERLGYADERDQPFNNSGAKQAGPGRGPESISPN